MNASTKTLAGVFIVAGCLLFGLPVKAATNEYWVVSADATKFTPLLKSVDFATGKATTWRKLSLAYFYSGPSISPRGRFIYTKRLTQSTTSPSKIGIYLSDARGSFERLLADGYLCSGDPCPSSKTLEQGELSPDEKLVSYRKGSDNKILDLATGQVQVLTWKNISPVRFSPRGTFYYAVKYSGAEKQTLLWKSMAGGVTKSIALPKVSGINGYDLGVNISPDERYAVMGRSKSVYDATTGQYAVSGNVWLLDLGKKKVIDSFSVSGQLTSFVWMSSRKFVYEYSNGKTNDETRYMLNNVVIKTGKMTQTPVPAWELDRSSQLLRKISDTQLLLTRLDDSKSVNELIALTPTTGEFKIVYQANNIPTYYFSPVGPKQ